MAGAGYRSHRGNGGSGLTDNKIAEIDTAALRHNFHQIHSRLKSGTAVMAMVKANAYGHGIETVRPCLESAGVQFFGVSSSQEALELRALGCRSRVVVVGGTVVSDWPLLAAQHVEVAVHNPEQLSALLGWQDSVAESFRVHIKFDTGMNRIGLPARDAPMVLQKLSDAGCSERVAGVFTHFADADNAGSDFTRRQHTGFVPAVAAARKLTPSALLHCCNTAATLLYPEFHHDMVRPGLGLYGYGPEGVCDLRPVMTVRAMVTQVKKVAAGEFVGYGCTYQAREDKKVATVCVGYADGVHRLQGNRGAVVLAGVRCPIIGAVSMDQITVDCSRADAVHVGQWATLVGEGLWAEEVARASDTISYEVLTSVSARVRRVVPGTAV